MLFRSVGALFARKTKRGTKRKRDGDEAEGEEAEGDEAACPPPRRLTLGHYRDSMYFGMNAQNRSGADALACETPYGQRSLDAREYARIWRSGAAHAAVSLADEHGGWESAKKSKTAAIRTCAWLDACAKEAKTLRLPLFGALTGGEHAEVREECSRRVAERDDDVVGYALSGFFAGEDVSTRGACIEASLKHIPSEKPRYLSGTTTVEDIVDNIDIGLVRPLPGPPAVAPRRRRRRGGRGRADAGPQARGRRRPHGRVAASDDFREIRGGRNRHRRAR